MRQPLTLPEETIRDLIGMARQIHAKEEVVIPTDELGEEDWGAQVLADHASDPAVEGFRAAIGDLGEDQQADLVALMWVGRGDFEAQEWSSARAVAAERLTPRTAEYLLGTPLVADYWGEGLGTLGYSD